MIELHIITDNVILGFQVLFTEEQKEALRLAFALDPYPNVAAIEFLGRELGLSSRTITNWFHNHRMRLKQQTSNPLVQGKSRFFPSLIT